MDSRTVYYDLLNIRYPTEDVIWKYMRHQFHFRTVFYRSENVYCCCPCAFQHEFLTYISRKGGVDKEASETVLKNILDGQCSHVGGLPEQYIRETSICGVHIAAAIGPPGLLQKTSEAYGCTLTAIFQLDPFMLGVSKKNFHSLASLHCLDLYYGFFRHIHFFPFAKQDPVVLSVANSSYKFGVTSFEIKSSSLFKYCVDNDGLEIFQEQFGVSKEFMGGIKNMLEEFEAKEHSGRYYSSSNPSKAIKDSSLLYCVIQASNGTMLTDMEERLVLGFKSLRTKDKFPVLEQAITCNKPNLLQLILNKFDFNKITDRRKMTLCNFRTLCKLLRRDRCNDILSKPEYPPTEEPTLSLVEKVKILYRFLDIVYSPVRNELEAILAGLPKVNQCQAETEAYNLHLYIQEQAKARLDLDTRVFKTILNLGLNTDCLDSEGNTLLMAILKILPKHHLKGARSVVEIVLSGTVGSTLNTSAVEEGLKIDCASKTSKPFFYDQDGIYVANMNLHGFYGHDDPETLALNYYGPLLIECGLPYSKDAIGEYLQKSLPSFVLENLRQCIDSPRPLTLSCRDTLRNHFRDNIYQFVEVSGIPKCLRDFILLKNVLVQQARTN